MRVDRAAFFIDGNNWYHGCLALGLRGLSRLNYARVCQRLAGERSWVGTSYYIGKAPPAGNLKLAADQERFLARLRAQDPRISVWLGRLEPRSVASPAAVSLRRYLARLPVRIDDRIYRDLMRLATEHSHATVMVEKAVDVGIAVDMVVKSERDEYDTAYLLSADGDLTPAVDAVRASGKSVFVATPSRGSWLTLAANRYLRLDRSWFDGLFDEARDG